MDNVNSEMLKVGGVDTHYIAGGRGEPLLILHGGGSSSKTWLESAGKLSESYRVYVPDMPGFGQSQSVSDRFDIKEYVRFVDDFTQALGLERFYLVGHSLGGCIALQYALESPHKIIKLCLASSLCLGKEVALWVRFLSSWCFRKSISEPAIAITSVVRWLGNMVKAPFKLGQLFTRFKVDIGRSVTTIKGQAIVLQNELSELMVPTLLVWGAKDAIVPVKHAYSAAQSIPDNRLQVFDNTGHSVHGQKPSEFSDTLFKFFSQ